MFSFIIVRFVPFILGQIFIVLVTSTLRRDTWHVNQIIVQKRFWQSFKPFLTLSEWFPNLRLLCLKVIVEIISNGFLMRWMNFVLTPYCFSISSITPVTVSCGMFRNIPDVNQAVLSPITWDVVEKEKKNNNNSFFIHLGREKWTFQKFSVLN